MGKTLHANKAVIEVDLSTSMVVPIDVYNSMLARIRSQKSEGSVSAEELAEIEGAYASEIKWLKECVKKAGAENEKLQAKIKEARGREDEWFEESQSLNRLVTKKNEQLQEAYVYITLLAEKLIPGAEDFTEREIAERSIMNRRDAALALSRLRKKGLISNRAEPGKRDRPRREVVLDPFPVTILNPPIFLPGDNVRTTGESNGPNLYWRKRDEYQGDPPNIGSLGVVESVATRRFRVKIDGDDMRWWYDADDLVKVERPGKILCEDGDAKTAAFSYGDRVCIDAGSDSATGGFVHRIKVGGAELPRYLVVHDGGARIWYPEDRLSEAQSIL